VLEQRAAGKGDALAQGFAAATGDIVVTVDGDGSTDPAEIPLFVGALLAGADMVKGSRFLATGGSDDLTVIRTIGARGLTSLVNVLFGTRYTDLCYGYNAFWRDCLGQISTAAGFEVETSMNISAARAGLTVAEVPSYELARVYGTSNLRTVRDGLRVLGAIVGERARPRGGAVGSARNAADVRPADPPAPVPRASTRRFARGARISVVICAHTLDRWHELTASVASVLGQTRPAHEVIVVVDHDEALLERARAALPARVRVVHNEGAPGLSDARNTGVRHAAGDVVAFIDDDARADRDWLEAHAQAHEDPHVLGVGGAVEPAWAERPPAWMPPELLWTVGCSYRGLPTGVAPLRAAIGANMSYKRDVLTATGGFAEEFGRLRGLPMSCEDTEFAIRAQREHPGRVVMFAPDARVEHVVPPARTTLRYLRWRCWTEGRAKAELSRLAGTGASLSDERRYVARVLPAAFARGLLDAARGDRDGLARAAAIVAALSLTAAGYAFGTAARRPPKRENWS
jgi:glycosyltransferase involved in cell wall biosynthesis